jgi:hypothetical protein
MKKLTILILLTFALSEAGIAQNKYYEDTFLGGVTMGGYSPQFNSGGTGSFSLNIPAGSSIRTAYLLAGRHGTASNITVSLNGTNYTFDPTNQVGSSFQSPTYGGTSGVHLIDVTADINASTTSYSLTIPFQPGPSNRYNDFVLYVAYNNVSLPAVHTALFTNTTNFGTTINYTLNFSSALYTSAPVAVSLMTGFICDNANDGEKVKVENYNMGTIGNADAGSGTCGGPIGSFAFSNNALTGLNDDASNLSMSSSDALSDVHTKLASNATTFNLEFTTATAGNTTNAIWAVFVVSGYTGPLPVEFTQFSGVADGSVNRLHWTTASETNNAAFELEKSRDGVNFITYGSVQGAGNSTITQHYAFTDVNPFYPTTFYRLNQVDFDGDHHYSDMISVNNGSFIVTSVDVYTVEGRHITTFTDNGDNTVFKNLSQGMYVLHYHTDKGVVVKKMLCQPYQEPIVSAY